MKSVRFHLALLTRASNKMSLNNLQNWFLRFVSAVPNYIRNADCIETCKSPHDLHKINVQFWKNWNLLCTAISLVIATPYKHIKRSWWRISRRYKLFVGTTLMACNQKRRATYKAPSSLTELSPSYNHLLRRYPFTRGTRYTWCSVYTWCRHIPFQLLMSCCYIFLSFWPIVSIVKLNIVYVPAY